jgi:hypothetical protein
MEDFYKRDTQKVSTKRQEEKRTRTTLYNGQNEHDMMRDKETHIWGQYVHRVGRRKCGDKRFSTRK